MSGTNKLISNQVHQDWEDFLSPRLMDLLEKIEIQLDAAGPICPPIPHILHFLSQPLTSCRVIILGQDPYPQEGVATGRAFEVGTLQTWQQPFRNVSLQNIIRALVKAKTGKIYTFNEIRLLLKSGFQLLPPQELFKHWEHQGVLLLNTAFTCQINQPGSHIELWHPFTARVLHFISQRNPEIKWFLWGAIAAQHVSDLTIKHKVQSYHPSRCQPRLGDFLYGPMNCFSPEVSAIDWTGYAQV